MAARPAIILDKIYEITPGMTYADITIDVTVDKVILKTDTGIKFILSHADLVAIVKLYNQVSGASNDEFDKLLDT